MIGLLGIGLGLYGVYELTKEIKTTQQDIRIRNGVGSIYEQKRNIDEYFLDILEYGGAKCKIVRDTKRISQYKRGNKHYKIINAQPKGYGGTEIYLMEKGYSKEAIQYFKNKYDMIVQNQIIRQINQQQARIKDFEKALSNKKCTEMVVNFSTNANKHIIDETVNKMIEYLHTHHNKNARVNVTIGDRYSNNNFTISWVIFVPNGYDGHQYLEDIETKINKEMI